MENATQAQDGQQPQQGQTDPQQAASARAALVDSVAKATEWRLSAIRIYEVSLTAQLSGTIVHVQNGPVAQRWSRGLIILWFSVRIRVGPPQNANRRRETSTAVFFMLGVLQVRRCRPCP